VDHDSSHSAASLNLSYRTVRYDKFNDAASTIRTCTGKSNLRTMNRESLDTEDHAVNHLPQGISVHVLYSSLLSQSDGKQRCAESAFLLINTVDHRSVIEPLGLIRLWKALSRP
jgi:hypothetical protein